MTKRVRKRICKMCVNITFKFDTVLRVRVSGYIVQGGY